MKARMKKRLEALERRAPVDLVNNPEWWELKGIILQTLESFPEAREALVEALDEYHERKGRGVLAGKATEGE